MSVVVSIPREILLRFFYRNKPILFALIFLFPFCIGLALYGISSRKTCCCCILLY